MENILDDGIILNSDYIVCLPQYDSYLYESFKYCFDNVIAINDNVTDANRIIQLIKRSNIKKIVFVDSILEYNNIIRAIDLKIDIKFILTKALASITNMDTYRLVNSIFEYNKKNIFKDLGVLDENWYECLKNNTNLNVKLLKLDIKNEDNIKKEKTNKIGVLSECFNANHSYFNQLSAIKLNGKYIPNVYDQSDCTKDFNNVFGIECNYSQNKDYIAENILNLYINFTDNNELIFLKSMDLGIPCIMGNTKLLKRYSVLNNYLTVKSDDDINEIAQKIELAIENKTEIMEEYKKFRAEYKKESIEEIADFLDCKSCNKKEDEDENEFLLTVVVPVYNTEQYIVECLDSIYKAKIDNMEVLIINDGSTDNSENVIMEYMNTHPNFAKYIKQENHGLGNVRNVGMLNAKGKYIVSVDSDDTINSNFLKESKKYLEENIDLVICDWLSIPEKGENFETAALDYVFKDISEYKGLLFTTIMPSTCNKIIKKSLLESFNLEYAEGLKYEDLSFNPLVMLKASTIKYIRKPYYEYKIRGNSIMRTSAGYNMIDIIKMLDDRINTYFSTMDKFDSEEFKYYTYTWRIEEFIFNQIYEMDKVEINKYVEYTLEKIGKILDEVFSSQIYINGLNNLKQETKDYIIKRNSAIKENTLLEFLKEAIERKEYIKITPPMFYYGEK